MLSTYQELQDTIREWIARNELEDKVQTFIKLFETDAILDNRIRDTKRIAIALDGSVLTDNSVDLPADFQEVGSWSLEGSEYRLPLTAMGQEGDVRTDDVSSLGAPRGFLIMPGYFGADQVPRARLYPAISGSYNSNLIYRATITPLSSTNTTNWLLNKYPALYLYGALAETAPYLRDDSRLPVWEAKKENLIAKLYDFENRREYSGPTDVRYTLGGAEF